MKPEPALRPQAGGDFEPEPGAVEVAFVIDHVDIDRIRDVLRTQLPPRRAPATIPNSGKVTSGGPSGR